VQDQGLAPPKSAPARFAHPRQELGLGAPKTAALSDGIGATLPSEVEGGDDGLSAEAGQAGLQADLWCMPRIDAATR